MFFVLLYNGKCEWFAFRGNMRKFKAIASIILIIAMLTSGIWALVYFAKDSETKKVVVTTFPIYDICVNIMGNDDEIILLQDNGVDMHSYQPTVKDKTVINSAELFIYMGGHSDNWVGDIVRNSDNVNFNDLSLMNFVETLDESTDNIVAPGEHDHDHEHEHEDCVIDEHIWLSVKNMIKMTEGILEELVDIFPHIELYLRENAENYIAKLSALDSEFERVTEGKSTTIVLADRFPFLYLANDYGLRFVSAFSSCSTDSQASAEVVVRLIEEINANNLNYICKLETSDSTFAESVISNNMCRAGVQVVELNSCQSVVSNNIASMSYIDIMQNNLNVIERVLNNESN